MLFYGINTKIIFFGGVYEEKNEFSGSQSGGAKTIDRA
jgi:hypothetical protein